MGNVVAVDASWKQSPALPIPMGQSIHRVS